jgi:hypothetical protein
MDRCALFVDAGYVLADGAMAVHGTRRRDSVSWDYSGLLKLLAGISRDRTGLPMMRCYWYEATVEGRRTREHDMLADLPGLKLRLGRMRPGHREGVETEIHRDLIKLARNGAICDAVIISAEEDLAQVVAEVQDLGVRVILLHIAVDGSWTIARPLRQECDDIVELSGPHLRPFVDLIAGAEPAGSSEQYPNGGQRARALGNGHSSNLGALTHQDLPGNAPPSGSAIYTAPVITDYQRSAPGSTGPQPTGPQPLPSRSDSMQRPGYGRTGDAQAPDQGGRGGSHAQRAGSGGMHEQTQGGRSRPDFPEADRSRLEFEEQQSRIRLGQHEPVHGQHEQGQGQPGRPGPDPRQAQLQSQQDLQTRPELRSPPAAHARRIDEESTIDGYRDYQQPDPLTGRLGARGPEGMQAAAPATSPPPGRELMGRRELTGGIGAQYPPAGTGGGFSGGLPPQLPPPQRPRAQLPSAQLPASPFPGAHVQGPAPPFPPAGRQPDGPYSGPQPVAASAPIPQPVTVSLPEAVQAAHAEGFGFGDAVARDAPALWLEAVLARKPRMPSDLEARLLQGSALPIDSLLHDEVRHALRRGFWDALERSRR